MNLDLNNKTALVSASTSGIGFAIADRLLQEGATVIINGRTDATVAPAMAALADKYGAARVLSLTTDLSVSGAEQTAAAKFPQVDILINNMWPSPPRRTLSIGMMSLSEVLHGT